MNDNGRLPRPQYENYQPRKRVRVEYSPLRSKDVYLSASSDEDDEPTRKAKKARREKAASDYLHYGTLPIMTARLFGPFDSRWRNPWKKKKSRKVANATTGAISCVTPSLRSPDRLPGTPSSPPLLVLPKPACQELSMKPVRRSLLEDFREKRARDPQSIVQDKSPLLVSSSSPVYNVHLESIRNTIELRAERD